MTKALPNNKTERGSIRVPFLRDKFFRSLSKEVAKLDECPTSETSACFHERRSPLSLFIFQFRFLSVYLQATGDEDRLPSSARVDNGRQSVSADLDRRNIQRGGCRVNRGSVKAQKGEGNGVTRRRCLANSRRKSRRTPPTTAHTEGTDSRRIANFARLLFFKSNQNC